MLTAGEHFLEANHIRHWVRVAGVQAGLPLVAIHGGPGGNHYAFERTIGPALEAIVPVIYYEQRGSGRSAKPARPDDYSIELLVSDLEQLLEQLELPHAVLVGYSFGGELALEFALRHCERVAGLILQAPTPIAGNPEPIVKVQLEGFRRVARGEILQAVEAVLRQPLSPAEQLGKVWSMVDTATVDRFLFENQEVARHNRRLWAESGLTNTGEMHRALTAQPRSPLLERASPIAAPTLIAVGRYDRNVGLELCRRLCETMPNARLEVFEHSAHFPDMEQPERYAEVVRNFYQELL